MKPEHEKVQADIMHIMYRARPGARYTANEVLLQLYALGGHSRMTVGKVSYWLDKLRAQGLLARSRRGKALEFSARRETEGGAQA